MKEFVLVVDEKDVLDVADFTAYGNAPEISIHGGKVTIRATKLEQMWCLFERLVRTDPETGTFRRQLRDALEDWCPKS